jgi:hypothetical protein
VNTSAPSVALALVCEGLGGRSPGTISVPSAEAGITRVTPKALFAAADRAVEHVPSAFQPVVHGDEIVSSSDDPCRSPP